MTGIDELTVTFFNSEFVLINLVFVLHTDE